MSLGAVTATEPEGLFFDADADLEPCKHRSDRPERVHQRWRPLPATEFDEAEQAGGHPPSKPAVREPGLSLPVVELARLSGGFGVSQVTDAYESRNEKIQDARLPGGNFSDVAPKFAHPSTPRAVALAWG
jgi:hypothetical protein